MWVSIAALGAALLLVASVSRRLLKRNKASDALGVGKLSDAWLAERRRDPNPD